MKTAKFVSALAMTVLLGGALAATAQTGPGPRGEGPGPRPEARGPAPMMAPMMSPMGLPWSMVDTNGDDKVTAEDLTAALKDRFAKADTNGDGQLSAEELAAAIKAMEEARADARRLEMAKRMIDRADDNGDGSASADELRLPRGGTDFVKRFDTDGDGTVTKAEYDAKMKAMHKRMADRKDKKDPRHAGKGHERGQGKGPGKGHGDERPSR